MKKVFELLGMDRPIEGDFGIEIEAEGENMREVRNEFWKTEADGSLRGAYPESCAEFVLKKPIPHDKVGDAVQSLIDSQPGATFEFSFRTSVHIHVNVQPLQYEQLLNMMYTYLLLEEPLTTYCGRERKGNRFCLRLADAEGMMDTLGQLFNGTGKEIGYIEGDAIRYSAMNIAALPKYGSLEFRAMRGNMDKEVITTWCKALYAIREYAKGKNNPMEIYEEFRKDPPSVFLKNVLGDVAPAFLYPRVIRDVQRSFSLALDLPFQFRNAEERRKAQPEPPKAKKPKVVFDDPFAQPFAVPAGIVPPRAPAPPRGVAELDAFRRILAERPEPGEEW